MFPIKQERNLDLLDGNRESPQEHPHKSRMILMSPKECDIVLCIQNQLEMTPVYWIKSNPPFPIIQDRWLVLL